MEERIRQRLVGAVVLVALGVIFIPMLFDTPNEGWLGEERPLIPPKPAEIEELAKAPPPEIDLPPPKPAEAEAPTPRKPVPVSEAPREPVTDARLARWAVQVGSFSSRENALRLRDSLRKQGFKAYIEVLEENGKQITRVRVGPELDEARARRLMEELKRKAKIDGIVVRHR
ncbi:MAG: hypothetical protein Kow006_02060 [Gammaproteobacteria bacterium]